VNWLTSGLENKLVQGRHTHSNLEDPLGLSTEACIETRPRALLKGREELWRLRPLPHADFWNAASSTDSALRNVTLKIEDAMMDFAIANVVLLERTPIRPVVAELRFMWRPLRLFLIGLFAAAGVFVALAIVRVIWVLWHGGSAGGT